MIKFIFLLICIKLGDGFPQGAPSSVCTSMMPQHDVTPKKCQPVYLIQSDKSEFNKNDVLRITVRGSTDDYSFKGILLTATGEKSQQIFGTWSITNSLLKIISCDGTSSNAVTHSSPDDKSEIAALWHAPSIVLKEKIIIKVTIVKSYEEIYVDCFNITLTAKQNQSSNASSITANTEKDILAKINTNVTWEYASDTITATITAAPVNTGEWRSIGFSLDQQMGDEYVFICQVSHTGDALLRRMHTKLGKRPPSSTNEEVNVISAVYENGRMTCHFSFEITSEQADGEPVPIALDKNYYLIFAAGVLETEEQPAKHNFAFVTSKMYQLQNPEAINLDESITTTTGSSGASTSASTGSMTTSTTASQTSDVGVNVTWTYSGGLTHVKMIIHNLKRSQWFALGLSLDDLMGEDHVFTCQHLANETISLQRFFNPMGHSQPVLANTIPHPGGTFNVSQQKVENGTVYCDFTLSNFVETKRRTRQNDHPELTQTTSYRPLIAIGNMDGSNNLIRHSYTARAAIPQNVLLNRQETIKVNIQSNDSDSTSLMKAHGIIMVFVWIVLVSTGILIARYFKRSCADRKICGKAVWFAMHRTIMSCAALLTLISFILILAYKKGQWISQVHRREFAHSIIGILVICFALIQPFMALFRCNPDDRYRFIFNYLHATVGFSAFILSIAAIFLAVLFDQFHFRMSNEWAILVVWSCWLPVVFIMFELIEIYFQKYSSEMRETNSYDLNNLNSNGTTKLEPMPMKDSAMKDRIKALLLLFHIIVACGLALALVILIAQSGDGR